MKKSSTHSKKIVVDVCKVCQNNNCTTKKVIMNDLTISENPEMNMVVENYSLTGNGLNISYNCTGFKK